jgi:glycerophosphoryl diester phosphodiesterase
VAGRPQVVGHRGASAHEAEHTVAAYRRALDDGADGVECDVRLTRDGTLVCVHDRRVNRTSSGRGVVSALELADLHELDFGSWRRDLAAIAAADPEAPDRDRTGVLTLDRLLDTVLDCPRWVEVAIETKHPTRYAGLVEVALVELLARRGLTRPASDGRYRVRVMSFAAASLRRIRALAPGLPTVYLMHRVPLPRRDGSLPAGAVAGGPSLRGLRAFPGYVQRVHDQGGQVHVWTVDEPRDVEWVAGLGVDVIITNRPDEVRRQLD